MFDTIIKCDGECKREQLYPCKLCRSYFPNCNEFVCCHQKSESSLRTSSYLEAMKIAEHYRMGYEKGLKEGLSESRYLKSQSEQERVLKVLQEASLSIEELKKKVEKGKF